MKRLVSMGRLTFIALLALSLVHVSTLAKVSLYRAGTAAQITAQSIKLLECRLEHIEPVSLVEQVIPDLAVRDPEPQPVADVPAAPRPVVIPRCHFFRPPPSVS